MQNNILNSLRSINPVDGCKGSSQVYALNPMSIEKPNCHRYGSNYAFNNNIRNKNKHSSLSQPSVSPDDLLPYGLPSSDLIDPPIDTFLRSVDIVPDLASTYRRLDAASPLQKFDIYLQQYSILYSLNDPKVSRRTLRSARQHAPNMHHKLVLSAWLRYERRVDEFNPHSLPFSSSTSYCDGPVLECPQSALDPGYHPDWIQEQCPCRRTVNAPSYTTNLSDGTHFYGQKEYQVGGDVSFCIGEEEVLCYRNCIAALSPPLRQMLYGGFAEAKRETINFSKNGITVEGMRVIDVFSRIGKLSDDLPPNTILEILTFANKFCCESLKTSCDSWLTRLLHGLEEAILLMDYGLEEMAHHLVGACLQVFLRELPRSLHDTRVMRLFCTQDGKERLAISGHVSFSLYYFLGLVAMEEDMRSNTTVMLLERLGECAASGWQKQLALHQLGCVMLERNEYEDAQRWFEEAVEAGHLYSKAGLARAKYRRGNRYAAFKMINNLVCENDAVAWMYQERSLYCIGKDEKLRDLNEATKYDPTLSYPYKYRAIVLMEENKIEAAIAEIEKIIRFKVSTDCLELRSWFLMAREDYGEALRDIRALMTLDPDYLMFHGKVHGNQLVDVLQHHVPQLNLADCWMELYDRWSAVDDIGSLSIVHHMLAIDPCKGVLRFRQSLLLLRLNCQKAAMRSLRLARNNSLYEHERLVYEGWILYDTGHRQEALAKAEESISIQRSFEAFFLKAYALADTLMDRSSSSYVIELLNEALKCPSDGLRKGQALNNLGSVYVDCEKLDKAADCYYNALKIQHTRAHQGLARVYHLRNQRKAASDEMTRLIEKASNCASAYEKRSEYCDRDMAKTDLRRATELDPLRTYPYRYRAAVLMDDNREYEAIEELSKAISFKPDIQMLHLRAAFFESMGEASAALRDCEASLAIEPTHSDTIELYQKVSKQVHMN